MNETQKKMADVFNEWARRFANNPDVFDSMTVLDSDGNPISDYGQRCAIYFDQISADLEISQQVKRYHDIIDCAIELNLERRATMSNVKSEISKVAWAQEFCVVRCNIGRQAGNTEYIRQNATAEDLVVVLTDELDNQLRHGRVSDYDVIKAKHLSSLSSVHPNHKKYKTIFVDCPTYVFRLFDQSEFFRLLALTGDETFVFLGD